MTYYFLELLIFFRLIFLFGVYFSLHQRNTVYKYKIQRIPNIKEIQTDLHFHLPLILIFGKK